MSKPSKFNDTAFRHSNHYHYHNYVVRIQFKTVLIPVTVCHLNHITVHDGMPRPKAKVAIIDTRCPKFCLISTEHLFQDKLKTASLQFIFGEARQQLYLNYAFKILN